MRNCPSDAGLEDAAGGNDVSRRLPAGRVTGPAGKPGFPTGAGGGQGRAGVARDGQATPAGYAPGTRGPPRPASKFGKTARLMARWWQSTVG